MLARSTPDRAVGVQALAGSIALCSWARHFTLIVPLSFLVYKSKMGTGEFTAVVNPPND